MLPKKLLISLLLIFALLLVACGGPETADTPVATEATEQEEPTATAESAGEPDLTSETITFYHFGDLSGPLAGITAPLVHGFEDAVAAINDEGGIFGAEIVLEFRDTGGSVDEAVAAYDAFTSGDDQPVEFARAPMLLQHRRDVFDEAPLAHRHGVGAVLDGAAPAPAMGGDAAPRPIRHDVLGLEVRLLEMQLGDGLQAAAAVCVGEDLRAASIGDEDPGDDRLHVARSLLFRCSINARRGQ